MVYLLLFLASFVGSGLKAVGGFGFATLTTPVVALFWNVPMAIGVISIPTLLMSFMNAWRTREAIREPMKPYILFFVASLIGLGFGLIFLLRTDARLMKLFLGAFIVGQTLLYLVKVAKKSSPHHSPFRSGGMGLLAGIMLATVNMPSHVIATYLSGLNISKGTYLFTLSACQVALRGIAIFSLFLAGIYTPEALWLVLIVSLPVLFGYVLGTRFYNWLSDRVFFQIILGILLVMGSLLVFQNRTVLLQFF
jgi:uncharacterized membrane protein YfcA